MRKPTKNSGPGDSLKCAADQLECPAGYAKLRLGYDLHPTQSAVLDRLFMDGSRVLYLCGNETGKTRRVITTAILYAVEIMGATVVSTAGVSRQIREQLIPSLKSHSHRYALQGWEFQDMNIKVPQPAINGVKRPHLTAYHGFVAKDENYFQGYHKDDDKPLLIILDESQGISYEIAQAAEDRCNPTFFLAAGSPGDPSGWFYDAITKHTAQYQLFRLNRMQCLTRDGYWCELADIERLKEKYGADNPFYQSTVLGQYGGKVEGALLSLGEFDKCVENGPYLAPIDTSDQHVFIDFAAGRNKNVIAHRRGNVVRVVKKWREMDTMAAVGQMVIELNALKRDYGIEPWQVSGDADGLGLPMVHRLREVGWPISEWHGGQPARFDTMYKNGITEAWGNGCGKIKKCEIAIPDDSDFKAQVLSRKTRYNSTGKMELESKEDMAKRGMESPDEADAILGCMMPALRGKPANIVRELSPQEEMGVMQGEWENDGPRRFFS